MLTTDGADPFAKLLPLALSPSKDKLQPGSKKERKEDKNNTATSSKPSSLTGAEAENLLGSLDKPAPPKRQSNKDSSSFENFDKAFSEAKNSKSVDMASAFSPSSSAAGFDDAFSPTGNNAGSSKKTEGPWIDF